MLRGEESGGEDAAMIKKCLDFSGTASGRKVSTTKSAGGCQEGKSFELVKYLCFIIDTCNAFQFAI